MTDLDLDAIRARAEAAGHVTVRDVTALLARLAEVEAERDAARARAANLNEAMRLGNRAAEEWQTKAEAERDEAKARANEAARLSAEARDRADDLHATIEPLKEQIAAWACNIAAAHNYPSDGDPYEQIRRGLRDLAAENARLRPVVEAAELYRRQPGYMEWEVLIRAVDAYRAAQKAPASPPESTLGDEQAESAVASTNTAQAQRGVQRAAGLCFDTMTGPILPDGKASYLVCDLPAGHDGAHSMVQDGGERAHWKLYDNAPADPPGLDAAIEAAVYEFRREEFSGRQAPTYVIEAAVRAAAPALRAGALREAAAEIRRLDPVALEITQWMIDRIADVVDERADRIGGVT